MGEKKKKPNTETVECSCGCGTLIPKYCRQGGCLRMYAWGHNRSGKKHTEESIEKMRVSHGRGENHYFFGKRHSEETKRKIGKSRKKAWMIEKYGYYKNKEDVNK